jgi:ribosomal protein S27AE
VNGTDFSDANLKDAILPESFFQHAIFDKKSFNENDDGWDDASYELNEDEEEYDGHPSWYEPKQCSRCDGLFMPGEKDSIYCGNDVCLRNK